MRLGGLFDALLYKNVVINAGTHNKSWFFLKSLGYTIYRVPIRLENFL